MAIIQTREELLMALTEACELEHGLACQYLFAEFSLKSPNDPTLTAEQKAAITDWSKALKRIAREEMAHFGTVVNLLSAIGGAPHFRRPNFPRPGKFYPPNIPFWLTRFDRESLGRYVEFERNHDAPPAALSAPQTVPYRHVGELYAEIVAAFQTLDEATLFINKTGQDVTIAKPTNFVIPLKAETRAEAVAALTMIMHEGEAYEPGSPYSHYIVFRDMRAKLKTLQDADPNFQPSHAVAKNPLTRPQRGVDMNDANLITNPTSRGVVEWYNQIYMSMLLTFQQFYAFAGETGTQRQEMQQSIIWFMMNLIGPLGREIAQLPLGDPANPARAGASFELYGEFLLSTNPTLAWTLILEKLTREIADGNALAVATPMLALYVSDLTNIRDTLDAVKP